MVLIEIDQEPLKYLKNKKSEKKIPGGIRTLDNRIQLSIKSKLWFKSKNTLNKTDQ